MKHQLPNEADRLLAKAVSDAVNKANGKGTLTDNSGKEHLPNFAQFCKTAVDDGHNIVVIKETYQTVIFTIDDWKTEYPKLCKDNKWFYKNTLDAMEMAAKLRKAGLLN